MCTTPCHNGSFAVGFQGGVFVVLNEEDLTMKSVFQATGSPQVALWDKEYILTVSYLSGVLSWWTSGGECVHEVTGGPRDSIMHVNWTSDNTHKTLWVAGIMYLSYVELLFANDDDVFPSSVKEKYQIKYHEVTGCGFDLSDDNLAASGDFTGNVFVWEKDRNEPLYSTKHEMAVRSLVWNNNKLFIGCLDGIILKWTPSNSEPPDICLVCTSGVLSLRWAQNKLAVGLENGDLLLYSFSDEEFSDPVELLNHRAHSLTRDGVLSPAEVWSVCWSPCRNMIATASEDQTTCIWNASNGKCACREMLVPSFNQHIKIHKSHYLS
jgi:WD40 repeat protein